MENEDIVYQEENQYFGEGDEIFDDYEGAPEYIEVDGRLVLHNPRQYPSTSNEDEQNYEAEQLVETPLEPMETSVIKSEPPSRGTIMQRYYTSIENAKPSTTNLPPARKVTYTPKPSISSQQQQYPYYDSRDVWKESPPAYYGKSGPPNQKSIQEMQQLNAFNTMKNQVHQVQLKTKKKLFGPGQRKPCNCTKSQCLKLYCDCFANGEFCRDCNCKDCHNNIDCDSARTEAIRQSLERNPNAFKPKIGIARSGATDIERLHQKGCHCKKSGCLKNYCECYEAKVPCTDRCKCKGCNNTEAYRNARFNNGSSANALLSMSSGSANTDSNNESLDGEETPTGEYREEGSNINRPFDQDPRRFPWFYMTDEVVEAATLCMVAQAEEALNSTTVANTNMSPEEKIIHMERLVLDEFGRCLKQIIENANESAESMDKAVASSSIKLSSVNSS